MLYSATVMIEILNYPVTDLSILSESGRNRVEEAQTHGAAKVCVPVRVEISGGEYQQYQLPKEDSDAVIGEYQFGLFSKVAGGVVERMIIYGVTRDGSLKRLIPSQSGWLQHGEINRPDSEKFYYSDSSREQILVPKVNWFEDSHSRGVDVRISYALDLHTGKTQSKSILNFIAVPEPGQWSSIVNRSNRVINSIENPISASTSFDIIF